MVCLMIYGHDHKIDSVHKCMFLWVEQSKMMKKHLSCKTPTAEAITAFYFVKIDFETSIAFRYI